MSTISEVIGALSSIEDEATRGIKFEKLMVRYFELDPTLKQRYSKVSRWTDWEYAKNKGDTGIDLVAFDPITDSWTAIQCKFYNPTTTLSKGQLDSFFTASGKTFITDRGRESFHNRIIISTTDRWGKNAEDALEGQTIPVQRIGMGQLTESPILWDIQLQKPGVLAADFDVQMYRREKFEPREHQKRAIEAVLRGFATHDRGKLIMACGTGKTFTSLRLAERIAAKPEHNGSLRVLFCVPSIALLGQSLNEWHSNSTLDLRSFAVCSDRKVAKKVEDISAFDVQIPVTTDSKFLAEQLAHGRRAKGLNVVFSTYQSLETIHEAQSQYGAQQFDVIICDEAHRTTGITLVGEEPSAFTRIHDSEYIRGSKRLYMTATPRIYTDQTKSQAQDHFAELASMDDESTYGPEFYRLGFGEAVDKGLLTDYKVLVIAVDEGRAATTLHAHNMDARVDTHTDHSPSASGLESPESGTLALDDASKLIGAFTALTKRSGSFADTSEGFKKGEVPMKRAVAFAPDIKSSKNVAQHFPTYAESYSHHIQVNATDSTDLTNLDTCVEVQHVDGTMNALERANKLAWLKAPVPDDEVRILTNARCLSEGVDVPVLDAVLFLNPRNSMVDVVQSVGRVMRKADNKDYGYIILPVAVPSGVSPSQALADNQRFKVVWEVLNALRAHDERFDAEVNSLTLNRSGSSDDAGTDSKGKRIITDFISGETDAHDGEDRQLVLFTPEQWQEAISARIVDKVGTRTYWEDWAESVADIARRQITRINTLIDSADAKITREFDDFVDGLKRNLNEHITRDDAISMLSQHLITAPVFNALFSEHDFAAHNPVSLVMQRMVDALQDSRLDSETDELQSFYESVRVRASEVTSPSGKQTVVKELYEKFFRTAFKKQSESLGIVYTPIEIVDFILRSADYVSRQHFGRGLTDENVHVLDPFTGTGTFIVRLLQSEIIRPEDLARKFANELHVNEIMLLAYYVAAVNIETTYNALQLERALRAGKPKPAYVPFDGIVLTDTFQMTEADDQLDKTVFAQNNERAERQLKSPINVIIGNPPYSVGQSSANDLNANLKYPTLDARIENTYAKRSTATNMNSLYDSYIRAFRWATDRVGDNGIVAFVSNGGWIDGNTADGIRLSLVDEYSELYVFNLRGNQRTAGEQSRREGGKVFGSGSRATIAIFIGVKNSSKQGCKLHYRDVGDYLSTEEKLSIINSSTIDSIDWETIEPNEFGDWIGQRSDNFSTWPVIGDKKRPEAPQYFESYSSGLKTGRDAWVYNYSEATLTQNVLRLVAEYAEAKKQLATWPSHDADEFIPDFITTWPNAAISWNRSLKQQLERGLDLKYRSKAVTHSLYRPFTKQQVYFDRQTSDMIYQLPSMFPTPEHDNIGIGICAASTRTPFSILGLDQIPNLGLFMDPVQFFPRWTWEKLEEGGFDLGSCGAEPGEAGEVLNGYRRVDNITDEILGLYRDALDPDVTKDKIFYFVYAQLHDAAYREAYEVDLKKMLPHIETPTDRERFDKFVTAGRELMTLHVGYESVEPWPLNVVVKDGFDLGEDDRDTWRVTKLKWGKVRDPETKKQVEDRTRIIYNQRVTIEGIPLEANEYLLGSRSALAWIIDRYKVSTDPASGIVNDPNDWADEVGNPRYIVDLIAKVTRVAVETVRIVKSLND